MYQNDGQSTWHFSVWQENVSTFLFRLVESTIEPNTGSLSLTNLLLLIEEVDHMSSNRGSVHHTNAAFLDNSSSTDTITHELNNEQTDAILELWEFKSLSVQLIWLVLVLELEGLSCIQTIQVHCGVKWLKILLVVSLCVELKNFHLQK